MNYILYLLIAAVVSYLIGSISFAVVVSKIFTHDDVRNHGSGNAGMTNVVRTVGILPGVLTFLGDCLKGVAAAALGQFVLFGLVCQTAPEAIIDFVRPEYGGYICGLFCLIGHAFPILFGFRGGKGVATTLGILLVVSPIIGLFALLTFIAVFTLSRIVSLSSVIAGLEIVIYTALTADFGVRVGFINEKIYITFLTVLIVGFVIIKHKDNVGRLLRGEEKPLKSKKREG